MNIIFFILIGTALVNALLFILIYTKNRKNESNFSFALVILGIALWSATNAICLKVTTVESAIFWSQLSYFSGVLISSAFLYFSIVFPPRATSNSKNLVFGNYYKLYLAFLAPLISLIIFVPDFTIQDVNLDPWKIITGPGLYFFALYFFLTTLFAFINLVKKYLVSEGNEKLQLKYLFLGLVITSLFGGTFNLIFPLFGDYRFVWMGPFFALFTVGFVFYAIVKHRLMDIRVAVGKTVIYVSSFLFIALFSYVIFFLLLPLDINPRYKIMTVALLSALVFNPALHLFERMASRYLYYSFYFTEKTLRELGEKLTEILDIRELTDLITSTLMDTLKTERAVILIRDENTGKFDIAKNIGFKEENGISLVQDNFLTEWLKKNKKPLVYEELSLLLEEAQDRRRKKKIEDLLENMRKIEANICLPLIFRDKIVGIIVLGEKRSGDPYFKQDIELLNNLSHQVSVAVENARLYLEVQDLSQNLEKKVESQVKELKRAYRKLQRIDKTKTEFMSIVSHQLRTPLSIIKGHLSMLNEGVYDDDEEKKKKVINNVYQANERLIALVNDVLNISRIQSGRVEINKEEKDVVELVRDMTEKMNPSAEEKGIDLVFHEPQEEFPLLNIDASKIENVLINLIDNAIKYTEEGSVELRLERKEESVIIRIDDTGEGMSREELDKLFETFSRGSAGKKHWIQGSGLGLYIARQFVEMHDGKVWAESEGKGKGSTFYIELPL